MALTELIATSRYPDDNDDVFRFYQSATKFVRYLFQKYPAELFPKFVEHILDTEPPVLALGQVYGDEFRDVSAFNKRFQTSIR